MSLSLAPQHRKIPFGPRDPHEPHRAANTLELLYDLAFVVAFGVIGVALVMATAGVPIVWCLLVLAATPVVSIVGYELHGHAHINAVFAADDPVHPST